MVKPHHLFVTGMFRSGTTLIARMLASHPAIAFANDPYAPLFKALRNAVAARETCEAFDSDAPLDDYYFDASKITLLDATRTVDLASLPVPDDLTPLRAQLALQCQKYSPRIESLLHLLEGANFAELIASGYRIVAESYGNGDESTVGIKEVWTGEFVWPFLNTFPHARAIVVVRDPRAVVASKNVRDEMYPWLFLTRQWRKLAALAWLASHDDALSGRVHLLRYEDLISNPEIETRAMCQTADVTYDARLTDPSEYRDGAGAPWFQNSSHFSEVRTFNTGSITRWRDVLDRDEIAFVEAVCWPEMLLFGYEPEAFDPMHPDDGPFDAPPIVPLASLAHWVRPYAIEDSNDACVAMAQERRRLELLTQHVQTTKDEIRSHLLDLRLHQPLKDAIDNRLH